MQYTSIEIGERTSSMHLKSERGPVGAAVGRRTGALQGPYPPGYGGTTSQEAG